MDTSALWGASGIVATIVAAWIAYVFTERASRRTKWSNAKDVILQDLSRSLGEGVVPPAEAILATVRSVMRVYRVSKEEKDAFDEVTDDLVRQITSDPFLGPDRRTQLVADVLALKGSVRALPRPEGRQEGFDRVDRLSSIAAVMSLAAGLATAMVTFGATKAVTLTFRDALYLGGAVILVVVIALTMWQGFRRRPMS